MTAELPNKFSELRKIVERIERIIKYDAPSARGLPDGYASKVSSLSISRTSWVLQDTDSLKAANNIKEAAINSERIRGERERDSDLKKLSVELESLRAVLSSMAADACIEIGVVGRAMKEEAVR
jgi:hypothetical protein